MQASLRHAFDTEITAMRTCRMTGDLGAAQHHLERAHILGQRFALPHARSHAAMLGIAWRRRDPRAAFGQITRLLAALLVSRIWVPLGNTGGSDVSAFRPMPLPPELAAILRASERRR